MKKKDFIIVVGLSVLICIGYFIFEMFQGDKDIVEVTYQKEVIERIDLSIDHIYTFQGTYGKFSLEVKDGQYRATHVECPNHDCEKIGWVKKGSSKTIVCLPNEIYVMQVGMEDEFQ